MRKIDTIIVHCSDSPDTLDIGVDEIRQWHLERGWSDIGYHFVIRRSGAVEPGRPEERVGAHVRGHNAHSIGVCWVGRDQPADEQYRSLVALAGEKVVQFGLTPADVRGHREVAPLSGKTCPNIDMERFRADVAAYLRSLKN